MAGVASIGFGFWDRASGRNANGSYFVVLGAVALAIAFVSFLKRARRT